LKVIQRNKYNFDDSKINEIYVFGSKEFCEDETNLVDINKLKYRGIISFFKDDLIKPTNLIIISTEIGYYSLSEEIRKTISANEFLNLTDGQFKIFNVNNSTIILSKMSYSTDEDTSYNKLKLAISDNSKNITSSPLPQLKYLGKCDVTGTQFTKETLKDLNHYEFDMGSGYPIEIYVTDHYDSKYGKGFGYEDIPEMFKSISKFYTNYKPYEKIPLSYFFYGNTDGTIAGTPEQGFSLQQQAACWADPNRTKTEITFNADSMSWQDFRQQLLHETVHYYDLALYNLDGLRSFYYDAGSDGYSAFWFIEGSAQYLSSMLYDLPKSSKNNLPEQVVLDTKEKMIQYSKDLCKNNPRVVINQPDNLVTFNDIYRSSKNNYGVVMSLFWYLEKTFGYESTYKYASVIDTLYKNSYAPVVISQEERDKVAVEFYGKTEKEILKDWLVYFDNFK
jgi:hypothetical protein